MELNSEQIAFFKANGYLLIPGALDLELCAKARDLMWAQLPEEVALKRDDPASHLGPFSDADSATDSLHVRQGYRWQSRTIGTSQTIIDLVYSSEMCQVAEQLLGTNLRQPVRGGTPMGSKGPAWPGGPTDPVQDNEGARGVYFTLPYGDKAREPDQCHTDGHPFQLGLVGLIDDVPPDGGAFKVWPKSHQRLYPTFKLRYDQPRIPYYDHLPTFKGIIHSDEYLAEIERLHADTQAVECWGNAGDVVLWHHRTAHMAGHNYTSTIRQAVLADFWSKDLDQYRTEPPDGDMWRDWSPNVQNTSFEYSKSFAEQQRLTL